MVMLLQIGVKMKAVENFWEKIGVGEAMGVDQRRGSQQVVMLGKET